MNRYPLWKYLLILLVLTVGALYAAPNLYTPDPAVQVSTESSANTLDETVLGRMTAALDDAGIAHFGATLSPRSALVRLEQASDQLPARRAIKRALGDGYVVALNLAPTTPDWLRAIGAGPMKLGLDLSGGVHFLLEVDIDSALETRLESLLNEVKTELREARVRGIVTREGERIRVAFASADQREVGTEVIQDAFPQMERRYEEAGGKFLLWIAMAPSQVREIENYAVSQNLTTLRNRVNELGVAEPLVQKQGSNRIVVELPGVQDTAEAKRILGKTANLEFHLAAKPDAPAWARQTYPFRSDSRGAAVALEKRVIITGDRVANARAGFDPQSGRPEVNITLDSQGGKLMHRATYKNIGRNLGVLFIERKTRTHYKTGPDGREVPVREKYDQKQVISYATIKDALGAQFRITGLDSPAEAAELALLLRSGALAAPMDFVEERTVGPSLGAENIALGKKSVMLGLVLVLVFMVVYYRVFGLFADMALLCNLVVLVACMSLLSATLTLPGIAGIVLTVGMAVDANVLIFARIREELANGMPPQSAISAGYDRAFITILDANLTTLIVALILYLVGTGPIRGFAVTLSFGIVTSMFTAIMGTRALANLWYGTRKVERIAI